MAVFAIGLVSQKPHIASAAAAAAQCNGEMNGGGTEVACTVTVVNYVTGAGSLSSTPPSTLTLTRCVGASGPLSTLTCTTTTSTSTQPVTTVQQCNGSGSGGGGSVVCTVTVTNHFSGAPAAITAATVYQCVGSVITGTGAPGTCTPVNTPGITSVSAATVGQCNGSGNGGTSVGFVCTVTGGSTMTATLPVNVDQCNGSGNGGGALVTCQATVANDVIVSAATPTPTAVPTAAPTSVPTVAPTAAPPTTPAPTPPPLVVVAPGSTPPGLAPAQAVPPPSVVAPRPAATGDAGFAGRGGTSQALVLLLGIGTAGLVLTGRRLVSRRNSR